MYTLFTIGDLGAVELAICFHVLQEIPFRIYPKEEKPPAGVKHDEAGWEMAELPAARAQPSSSYHDDPHLNRPRLLSVLR